MKIVVIAPICKLGGSDAAQKEQDKDQVKKQYERKKCCTDLPADFEFVFIERGPSLVLNAYDQTHAAEGVVKRAVQAEREGADAIIINCTADTALQACREAVNIPVIGPTESTMLYSTQFTDQIAVLTFSDRINGRFIKIARELGMAHRLTCSKTVSLPPESDKGKDDVVNALFDAIKEIYLTTLCDSFMLGCSDFEGMGYMMGCPGVAGVEEGLREKLAATGMNICLYKPFEVAVYQAYVSALMHVGNSRKTYPSPHTLYE